MAVTKEDLLDFTRFADSRLSTGTPASLVDLVGEWEAQRQEMEETVADIAASHADIEAGRTQTVSEAFAQIRSQLVLQR